jgi:hypothetical protein
MPAPTHIEDLFAEASDTFIVGILVGEDGETPIDPDIVTAITATLRDKELADQDAPEALIFEDRDVLSALQGDGTFRLPLSAADTVAIGDVERQLRLLTLTYVHSAGKIRHQEITFFVDQMQDV